MPLPFEDERDKAKMMRRLSLACAIPAAAVLYAAGATAGNVIDPAVRPAQPIAAHVRPAMFDVVRAGTRLVAVGERGIILVSSDNGISWKQAQVPVAVTLTALRFVDEQKGWAVGHSGIVLHTSDGGMNWTVQLDGKRAADLVLKQAQAGTGPDAEKQVAAAKRLVEDGADKPFLALEFENERNGFITGAYGQIFRTEDGGTTWMPWQGRVPNPKGMHLYAIRREGSSWTLAGEQGFFARSTDGGQRFSAIETPYRGTYFTLAAGQAGEVLLAGLRGHAYRFVTASNSFEPIEVPVSASLAANAMLADGRQVFVNQSGQWLIREGNALRPFAAPAGAPANAVVAAADGAVIAATWRGLNRYHVSDSAGQIHLTPTEKK